MLINDMKVFPSLILRPIIQVNQSKPNSYWWCLKCVWQQWHESWSPESWAFLGRISPSWRGRSTQVTGASWHGDRTNTFMVTVLISKQLTVAMWAINHPSEPLGQTTGAFWSGCGIDSKPKSIQTLSYLAKRSTPVWSSLDSCDLGLIDMGYW